MTARKAAFTALKRVGSGGYSTLTLDSVLSRGDMSQKDISLATALFYGVQEKSLLLDNIISGLLKKRNQKLENDVRTILQIGIYQLAFMEKIPESAAVNESVKLAKQVHLERASGFINGILRSFIREGKQIKLPERSQSPCAYLSLLYSCPEWLTSLWTESYGEDRCEKILKTLNGRAPVFARVNNLKTSLTGLTEILKKDDVKVITFTHNDSSDSDIFEISNTRDIEKLDAYQKGLFHIQDISSQVCCKVADPKAGERIIDVCAAPGGKSYTLSEMTGDNAEIISCDIHPKRVQLIQDGANRLGIRAVKPLVRDASDKGGYTSRLLMGTADKVLCDVPCSGLGVIRRKPDIKNKAQKELEGLPELQYKILQTSSGLLKEGGSLIYSTCTLNPKENIEVVERFLSNNPDYEPYKIDRDMIDCLFTLQNAEADEPVSLDLLYNNEGYAMTIFPSRNGSDGFFTARIKRKG